jgi:hypothetical protein
MESDSAGTEVDYEVSGSIMDFELTEKPDRPRPNDSIVPELKLKNSPAPQIGQSNLSIIANGLASIVLTVSEPAANNRSSTADISFIKQNVETTAQEMASMLVAHIVTESNSFIKGFNLDRINNEDQDKDGLIERLEGLQSSTFRNFYFLPIQNSAQAVCQVAAQAPH